MDDFDSDLDEARAKAVAEYLHEGGFQTLAAGDGVEGIEMARQHKPDLITLDISMPNKSGVAVYTEMRADPELAGIPILVVTAVVDMRKLLWSRKTEPLADPLSSSLYAPTTRSS